MYISMRSLTGDVLRMEAITEVTTADEVMDVLRMEAITEDMTEDETTLEGLIAGGDSIRRGVVTQESPEMNQSMRSLTNVNVNIYLMTVTELAHRTQKHMSI